MLSKINLFLNGLGEKKQIQVESQSEKKIEDKILDSFEVFIVSLDDGFPKKGKVLLEELLKLLRGVNFNDFSLEVQSEIRRVIEVDIKIMKEIYLSLPKAHAISVVLENGKTAKDTLIENLQKIYNRINSECENVVNEKTKSLLLEKNTKPKEKKVDFFDL